MDFGYLAGVLPLLLAGLGVTLIATVLAALIALVAGLLIACIQVARVPVLTQLFAGLIIVIRNTPLLAQLFFAYYVLPKFGLLFDPLTVGVVVLGMHFTCYAAEAYRGGFAAVPAGQWEAARILGLRPFTTFTRVVLPQAIPPVLPSLSNILISMLKDTAVLSAITIPELVGVTKNLASISFQYTTLFTAMGVIFLIITLPASYLVRRLERRTSPGRHER